MKKLVMSILSISLMLGCVATIDSVSSGAYAQDFTLESTTTESPYKNMSSAQLTQLVESIGQKLVSANNIGKTITFRLSMEDIPNAFTDIDDVVTVYKGLIDYCETPDELAFIIGHELGHAANSHVVKSVGANIAGGIAVDAATRATAMSLKNSQFGGLAMRGANIGSSLANTAVQNKYARSQEFTADYAGIDYMTKAGYNPRAAVSIMNKIGVNYRDFWTDHPSTDKRVDAMNKYIQKQYPNY